jgi:hypothetical protein
MKCSGSSGVFLLITDQIIFNDIFEWSHFDRRPTKCLRGIETPEAHFCYILDPAA